MAVNSNRKGKEGERAWAKYCREQGYDVKRTQQYCGNTGEAADCTGLPWIHQEVKYYKTITDGDIKKFVGQSIREAGDNIPIVAHKENYGQWHVSMDMQDFVCMYTEAVMSVKSYMMPRSLTMIVTMTADDWFVIYKEFEAGRAIQKREV